MRAKTVNESLLEHIPNWVYIASALFFLYKFLRGYLRHKIDQLKDPEWREARTKKLEDRNEKINQSLIKDFTNDVKKTLERKMPIKYNEDILYYTFEVNTTNFSKKENFKPDYIIKINKENKIMNCIMFIGKKEINFSNLKLNDEQYNKFLNLVNKIRK